VYSPDGGFKDCREGEEKFPKDGNLEEAGDGDKVAPPPLNRPPGGGPFPKLYCLLIWSCSEVEVWRVGEQVVLNFVSTSSFSPFTLLSLFDLFDRFML